MPRAAKEAHFPCNSALLTCLLVDLHQPPDPLRSLSPMAPSSTMKLIAVVLAATLCVVFAAPASRSDIAAAAAAAAAAATADAASVQLEARTMSYPTAGQVCYNC